MAEGTEGMVQRVIREVNAGTVFPMLTKTNYSDWALLMKVKLRARLLWTAIEKGVLNPTRICRLSTRSAALCHQKCGR